MEIILFGQLTEITGQHSLQVEGVKDTDALLQEIQALYPAMATVKYAVAIDKKIVSSNTAISKGNSIALLPPFSGG